MENISVTLSQSPHPKGVTALKVTGFLDTNTASVFEESFKSVLRDKKFKLVIDLTEVEYISSAGWGLFVSEIKHIRSEGGDLILAGMSPNVLEVFELLNFNTILKFFPDVETAVEKGFNKKIPAANPVLSPWKRR